MIKTGHNNLLRVSRFVDFGAFLEDDEGNEVLLPARYVADEVAVGDEMEVFVYNDSEDRLVAVTDQPYAKVGEFAFLKVVQVNKVGAFLDWGLPKDILVPYSEQKVCMVQGGVYPVYIYVDDETKRIVASAKLEKYLGNVIPSYGQGDSVSALVWQHTPLGYKAIVDGLHQGLIYSNEIFRPIEVGDTVTAYVKLVRDDGKIDLTLSGNTRDRVCELADKIMQKLNDEGGRLAMTDNSDPGLIRDTFNCSKKDFKKAVGKLYKDRRITLSEDAISIVGKSMKRSKDKRRH